MSSNEWAVIECQQCGNYYAMHLGACPSCDKGYHERRNAIIDDLRKPVEKAQKGAKEASSLERAFMAAWALTGLEMPVTEYRFCMTRRWRADFAWPDILLLVEMEGGLWGNGRHNRAGGYIADLEKYNYAAELGYTVLRYHKVDGDMLNQIERVYKRLLAEKAK